MYSNIKEVMGVNDDDVYQSLYNDISTHAQEGRVLYLSRHGESEFNLYGKIGVSSNIIIKLPLQYFHIGPKQVRSRCKHDWEIKISSIPKFFAETGQSMQRHCDVILHGLLQDAHPSP